jgi:hypothetical protein
MARISKKSPDIFLTIIEDLNPSVVVSSNDIVQK